MADAPLDQLASTAVFGGLARDELEQVAERLGEHHYTRDEWVVREGEPAREMFVVRQGRVEVFQEVPRLASPPRICTLGPGDCFGEMALIDVQPRSASVRALEDTQAWSLSAKDLLALCRWRPTAYALVVGNIAREISRRLRRRDAVASEFLAEQLGVDDTGS